MSMWFDISLQLFLMMMTLLRHMILQKWFWCACCTWRRWGENVKNVFLNMLYMHAAAMRTLPSPSSYAGVLLGILPPPSPDAATVVVPSTPSPAKPTQTNHTLPQMTSDPTSSPSPLKPSFVPIHAPQRRSHRLANQAELAGGRKCTATHKPNGSPWDSPPRTVFSSDPLFRVSIETNERTLYTWCFVFFNLEQLFYYIYYNNYYY